MNLIKMHIPAPPAVSYVIQVEADLLKNPETWLPEYVRKKKIVIITDDTVGKLYGDRLLETLHAYTPLLLSFSPGEQSKNYQTKHMLEERMLEQHFNRETLILALGGGVVGDLSGYIAATYMRGVSYIQLPTTLLAMVDSSVGGKTGINTDQGKNLIGAFWQPLCVMADLTCLTTLPQTHVINGLIEAIKMFLTHDSELFHYTNQHIDALLNIENTPLKKVIERAIQIKVDVVSADEKENNQRMLLNFGHTIGHALEKITDYKLLHGYAVALGMLVEAKISQLMGLLQQDEFEIIEALLKKLTIQGDQLKKFNPDEIIKATQSDKKVNSNNIRYVLLKKIGQFHQENNQYAHSVSAELVKQAIINVSEV